MKILFIGDSLVKGKKGVDWVKWLASKNPGWEVDNAGVDGETLARITDRAIKKLDASVYDMIFFEGGLTDLLAPEMSKRSFLFRQKFAGCDNDVLDNPEAFEQAYRSAIDNIKQRTNATVIVATLGCICEDLEAPINKKRALYNAIIRDIAIETGCGLVDAGAVFDGYLRRCRTRSYLMDGYWSTCYLDAFQCRVLGCPDQLSRKRKLHLTIDGVHLNSRGANLYRDETERQIKAVMIDIATSTGFTGSTTSMSHPRHAS